MLVERRDRARLMAGGTDLLIRMNQRAMAPEYVVGLKYIPGLDHVRFAPGEGLVIGAMARLSTVAGHPEVKRFYPALAQAAGVTATVAVRNMGTVVGNLCNAAPSADNAPPLLVHGAEVAIAHPGGRRVVSLSDFFQGPGLTGLEMGEIVKEVRVPPPLPWSGSNYQKISTRSKVDIAGVSVAAFVRLNEDGSCAVSRIALGAVAPIPLRAGAAEKLLTGRTLNPQLMAQAAQKAAAESSPITDLRATGPYRRQMVKVLTVRALKESLKLASLNNAGCEA